MQADIAFNWARNSDFKLDRKKGYIIVFAMQTREGYFLVGEFISQTIRKKKPNARV